MTTTINDQTKSKDKKEPIVLNTTDPNSPDYVIVKCEHCGIVFNNVSDDYVCKENFCPLGY